MWGLALGGFATLAVDGEPRRSLPLGDDITACVAALRDGHCADVGKGVAVAVPSWAGVPQLGRWLAGLRAAGVPVAALVDDGVLQVARLGPSSAAVVVLDLGPSSGQLSLVAFNDDAARLRRGVPLAFGMQDLWRDLLELSARVIVHSTRFDPLHERRREQALRQALEGVLAALAHDGVANGEMNVEQSRIAFTLTRDQVTDVLKPRLRAIAGALASLQPPADHDAALPVGLSPWPGVAAALADAGAARLHVWPEGYAASAASQLSGAPSVGPGAPLLRRLAAGMFTAPATLVPATTTVAPPERESPTHVLLDGVAHRILADGLVIGREPGDDARALRLPSGHAGVSRRHCTLRVEHGGVVLVDHSRYGTWVEARRVQGRARVAVGERLRVGTPGIELPLIRVD